MENTYLGKCKREAGRKKERKEKKMNRHKYNSVKV